MAEGWYPGSGLPWAPLPGRLRFRSVDACEREQWTLALWRKDRSGAPLVGPLLCRSWRCRRCARWRGAVDWSRVSNGVLSRDWWLYLVLTFDPRDWSDPFTAYRRAGEAWDHGLRRSIERRTGSNAYIQTWERHLSGWPHVNVLLSSDALRDDLESEGVEARRHGRTGRTCTFSPAWRQWLIRKAVRAGFGRSVWCEVIDKRRGAEAMTNYLVKLASELTGAPDKKGNQSPVNAPRHFRRIRASRGLLPKPDPSSGEWTGTVLCGTYGRDARLKATGELDVPASQPGDRPARPVSFADLDGWIRDQVRFRSEKWSAALNDFVEKSSVEPDPAGPVQRAWLPADLGLDSSAGH